MSAPATVTRLSISGMHCAGCVTSVERSLKAVPGVDTVTVNLAERTATVTGVAGEQSLIGAIARAGYQGVVLRADGDAVQEAAEAAHYRALWRKTSFAAAVGLPLFVADPLGRLPVLPDPGGHAFWLAVGALTFFLLVYSVRHFSLGAWKFFRVNTAHM